MTEGKSDWRLPLGKGQNSFIETSIQQGILLIFSYSRYRKKYLSDKIKLLIFLV